MRENTKRLISEVVDKIILVVSENFLDKNTNIENREIDIVDLKQTILVIQKNHLNGEKVDTRVVDIKAKARINGEKVVNF